MVPQSVTVSGFTTLIDVQNGEYFVPLYSTLFYSLIQGLNYRNIILFGKPYLRLSTRSFKDVFVGKKTVDSYEFETVLMILL